MREGRRPHTFIQRHKKKAHKQKERAKKKNAHTITFNKNKKKAKIIHQSLRGSRHGSGEGPKEGKGWVDDR